MENEIEYCLEIKTNDFEVINNLHDDRLMLEIYRNQILEILDNLDIAATSRYFIGMAPDNDSAGEDELLYDGILLRLIARDIVLPLSESVSNKEAIAHFRALVEHSEHCLYTVFEESGETKKQVVVEFMF